MAKSASIRLIDAIVELTKELKRYNDAHSQQQSRVRSKEEAELFRAEFSPEKRTQREVAERLSRLTPASKSESS